MPLRNTSIVISGYSNSYAALNGNEHLFISKMDIARGFLSIGKTHWTQHYKAPGKTILDFLHYWSGLAPYLRTWPNLALHPRFSLLDPTDKAQKSYHFGMGISKIIAEKILKVPYLQHVDSLATAGIISISSGSNERGDMVGLDKYRNWHVLEAKGRTYPPYADTKAKAKQQAEKITAIAGVAPLTKSYCIAYLNELNNQVLLHDPDDVPAVKVNIEVRNDDFIKAYYDKIFADFYQSKSDMSIFFEDQGTSFSLFRIGDYNSELYLGLEDRILSSLREGKTDFFAENLIQESRLDIYPEIRLPYLSIGADGIVLLNNKYNRFQRGLSSGRYINQPRFRIG